MNIYVVSRVYTDNTQLIVKSFVYKDEAEEYVQKELACNEENEGILDEFGHKFDFFEIQCTELKGMDE